MQALLFCIPLRLLDLGLVLGLLGSSQGRHTKLQTVHTKQSQKSSVHNALGRVLDTINYRNRPNLRLASNVWFALSSVSMLPVCTG